MSTLAEIDFGEQRRTPLARIAGEIDACNANGVSRSLGRRMPDQARGLILDLTETSYLDSAGIRLLIELAHRLRAHRQELRVVLPGDSRVIGVLRVTGVHNEIPIDETVDHALDALGAA